MKYRILVVTSTALCMMQVGCNEPERTKVSPNIAEQVSPVNTALATTMPLRPAPSATALSSSTDLTTVRTVLPPNPKTVGASLGRTFQGEIVADISTSGTKQNATFRYMASGDRMRMRLDGSSSDFDLIGDGKTLAVLDHSNHSFSKVNLSELSTAPVAKDTSVDRKNDLKRSENEDAVTFQAGLRCEEHTLKGPQTEIKACVGALPGAFERSVFERATGILVPAWLATLVDEDEIPLRAQGHAGNSGEFTIAVTRYSPEPLPDASFMIPANYRAQNGTRKEL